MVEMRRDIKYFQVNITLNSGEEIIVKIRGKDFDNVYAWIETLPGVKHYEEVKAVQKIGPHTIRNNPSKITQARMAAGLSQDDLADLLGVSRTQEQRWEYHYNRIRADTLKRIAEVLGVEMESLLEDE